MSQTQTVVSAQGQHMGRLDCKFGCMKQSNYSYVAAIYKITAHAQLYERKMICHGTSGLNNDRADFDSATEM